MEQNKKIEVEKVENKKREKKQKPQLVKSIKGRNMTTYRLLSSYIIYRMKRSKDKKKT